MFEDIDAGEFNILKQTNCSSIITFSGISHCFICAGLCKVQSFYVISLFCHASPHNDMLCLLVLFMQSKFPTLLRIYESYKGLPEFLASSPERQPDAAH